MAKIGPTFGFNYKPQEKTKKAKMEGEVLSNIFSHIRAISVPPIEDTFCFDLDSSEQGITDDSSAVPYDLDAYPVTPDAKSFDLDTCGADSDIELSDFCLYDTNPDFKIAYSGDDEEEEQIQKFFLQ